MPQDLTTVAARTRDLLAYGLPDGQVDDAMAALDGVATRPVRRTVAALTPARR